MTSADRTGLLRLLTTALLCGVLLGCGPATVVVKGEFPPPLLEPLPIRLGLWFSEDFRTHVFHDEARNRNESSWVFHTGEAQVRMWDTLLSGMFERVVTLDRKPAPGRAAAGIDAVLVPHIEEMQYAIPSQTSIRVYEIWMRYRFELLTPDGDTIAEWTMSSYGKTPTAFLQSDQEAVNLAAVIALRDAGANFATGFARVPGVREWLQARGIGTEASTP